MTPLIGQYSVSVTRLTNQLFVCILDLILPKECRHPIENEKTFPLMNTRARCGVAGLLPSLWTCKELSADVITFNCLHYKNGSTISHLHYFLKYAYTKPQSPCTNFCLLLHPLRVTLFEKSPTLFQQLTDPRR